MLNLKFDVEEAIRFYEHGCIEEWVHVFLKTVGGNIPFSEGLKKTKRYWMGPILFPLHKLQRICGPEENMTFKTPLYEFETHVDEICLLIKNGWQYPPLIVNHDNGHLTLNDGNHRFEALKRLNYSECWIILWDSKSLSNLDIKKLLN